MNVSEVKAFEIMLWVTGVSFALEAIFFSMFWLRMVRQESRTIVGPAIRRLFFSIAAAAIPVCVMFLYFAMAIGYGWHFTMHYRFVMYFAVAAGAVGTIICGLFLVLMLIRYDKEEERKARRMWQERS